MVHQKLYNSISIELVVFIFNSCFSTPAPRRFLLSSSSGVTGVVIYVYAYLRTIRFCDLRCGSIVRRAGVAAFSRGDIRGNDKVVPN